MEMPTGSSGEITSAAQALADIARQLSRLSSALAAYAKGDTPEAEALTASQQALDRIARKLEESPTEAEAQRLRREVLHTLLRNGPALFPELAAATLSLPDEIRPVLQAMEQEGLVEIQTVRGWQRVALTARGREEAGRV
jgi:predicted transcriptional regulator